MKSETVESVHQITLKARQLLMTEISAQLEGIYGLLPDGQCKPAVEYPALSSIPEAAETRQRLETLFADEQQAGLTARQARDKLMKEAAFTWLNRLVAFKMMETRGLLRRQPITRGQGSNGFKMWLTEDGNGEHRSNYEAGDLPQDGLGEGPRQRAYRHFLLAQCALLAQEVRVLFDPDNLPSRLCPRPQALRQLIELLNGEQYVASKLKLLESHIADLRQQRDVAQGRERRALEKQMAALEDVLDDIRAFAERIDAILQRGYTPHIDDGVLINMAPLWELLPSWQAEPKKCWEALVRGDYDWAHQAMDHWPERVRDQCKTNRSYAIAHGLA